MCICVYVYICVCVYLSVSIYIYIYIYIYICIYIIYIYTCIYIIYVVCACVRVCARGMWGVMDRQWVMRAMTMYAAVGEGRGGERERRTYIDIDHEFVIPWYIYNGRGSQWCDNGGTTHIHT
jgi:hypothetical protein